MRLPLVVLLLSLAASAQTTFTVTQSGCDLKILPMDCTLTTDGGTVTLDNRAPSRVGYLQLPDGSWVHGAYSHFIANPDGSRQPFSDVGFYTSDDGKVTGTFHYYAHYVATCSGKGCGPVVIGWHYLKQAGSTIDLW